MVKQSRRQFLYTAGAVTLATLLTKGCSGTDPLATVTQVEPIDLAPDEIPEVTTARLGFIALTDSAPLIIAKVKGFYAKYGIPDVEVLKQASWGTTRDNLVLGSGGGGIDGAHILTPMPYLMATGKITDGRQVPMYILSRLNVNGQGISVSREYEELEVQLDSSRMKSVVEQAKAADERVVCAMTFPGGTHDLWMRYWLAAGGIDPDNDVNTIVVPPPQMVANMRTGTVNAFCVGEPWNAQLINHGIGYSALTTGELWNNHPEKVLSLRADWVDAYPKATLALLKAVQEAQIWCDDPANKVEMSDIVSHRAWFNVPAPDIVDRAKGNFNYGDGRQDLDSPHVMKFWTENASYPFKSHDLWFLTENIRWGYLPPDIDLQALVDQVNREDLWREAAAAIGHEDTIPGSTSRGVETFFDGITFDPNDIDAYLNQLTIKRA
jgi:nitrate/nitrite transport system substrate-binding protein